MTASCPTGATPDRILLATDLSARCDRALDRAAQLAGEWQAELVALNILEPAASPDQALAWATGKDDEYLLQVAQQQLSRDLSGLSIQATLQTARAGDIATTIRDIAASSHANLVITGVARNEILGHFLLGDTVKRLARMLAPPLLVVRSRARVSYQRVVAATDFLESSRHALLMHATAMRLNRVNARNSWLPVIPAHVTVRPVIERGAVEACLTEYVRQHDIVLVVMGAHGRSGIMSLLLGNTAARLLDWLPCDAMIVRESHATLDSADAKAQEEGAGRYCSSVPCSKIVSDALRESG